MSLGEMVIVGFGLDISYVPFFEIKDFLKGILSDSNYIFLCHEYSLQDKLISNISVDYNITLSSYA